MYEDENNENDQTLKENEGLSQSAEKENDNVENGQTDKTEKRFNCGDEMPEPQVQPVKNNNSEEFLLEAPSSGEAKSGDDGLDDSKRPATRSRSSQSLPNDDEGHQSE